MTLTPIARSVVRQALEEGRIVLISLDREPGSAGRFVGSDFQRIMPEADQER